MVPCRRTVENLAPSQLMPLLAYFGFGLRASGFGPATLSGRLADGVRRAGIACC